MTKPSAILIMPTFALRTLPPAEREIVSRKRGAKLKHGCSIKGKKTRTYKIWNGMVARCHVKSATGYENYGGVGIKVCERWRDFTNFLSDMGEAPEGLSIDRKDSKGDYEPGNCRWATRQTQNDPVISPEGRKRIGEANKNRRAKKDSS